MIRLQDVTVYHRARGRRIPVVDGVSLEVPTGSTLGLVGAGGAGKSLLLKLLCGLVRPDAGRVFVDDDEVTALGEAALMRVRARVGMVFQNYALFEHLTVARNVAFPLERLGGVAADEIDRRVRRRLEQVHLPDIEDRLPSELSGGMKKRVCLARATIHDPPFLLCDDPTAGLDPVTTNRIFRLLKHLQSETGATAIIVSHEVGYLEPLCDHLALLDAGRLAFHGTPVEAAAAGGEVGAFLEAARA